MWRICYSCALAAVALGQPGRPDPAFDKVPFDEWLEGGHDARIRWSLLVPPTHLSEYLRQETSVSAIVDGDEFVKRPEPGRMVLFVEIRNRDNRTYRSHQPLSLKKGTLAENLRDIKSFEHVCIMPGEYEIAAAVYDTILNEHSLKRTKLRVPELHHDYLSDAWSKLPTVEVGRACSQQPLPLILQTEKPVRIEVVVNRPASPDPGVSTRLKVISQMEIPNGAMTITALDLPSRKAKTLKSVRNLNRLWAGFPKETRLMVDVHALNNGYNNAQFFVSEIGKRLESAVPEAERVLIILSDAKKFPKGEDLRPIEAAPAPGTRIFYIRCNRVLPSYSGTPLGLPPTDAQSWPAHPEVPSDRVVKPYRGPDNSDSLEQTLKPLDPRLYDVTTPEQFRHALAEIMSTLREE
jgi:hypothetical protein